MHSCSFARENISLWLVKIAFWSDSVEKLELEFGSSHEKFGVWPHSKSLLPSLSVVVSFGCKFLGLW